MRLVSCPDLEGIQSFGIPPDIEAFLMVTPKPLDHIPLQRIRKVDSKLLQSSIQELLCFLGKISHGKGIPVLWDRRKPCGSHALFLS